MLSVLALSSRFDGRIARLVVAAVCELSVLALSSRFDGRNANFSCVRNAKTFSTRSVESF